MKTTDDAVQQMGIASPSRLILRDFRQMPQLHFLRELVHNSIQARAQNISVGVDWVRRRSTGALKLLVADDGCGMTADQLVRYFNNLASSGGTYEGDEKYGVGAKGSCWPWNRGGHGPDTGMAVMSWVEGGAPEGAAILLGQNRGGEPALMSQYCADTEEYSMVVPADARYRPRGGHGTVVVLLGNDARESTFFGPGAKGVEDTQLKAMCQYLNGRYFDLPEGAHVRVFEFASLDAAARLDDEPHQGFSGGGGYRRVHGARHYLETKEAQFTDVVTLDDGTEVQLYALRHPREGKSRNDVGNEFRPRQVSCQYGEELYVVNLAAKETWPLYRAFGFGYPGGMRDVTIIVRPPRATLRPDGRMTAGVYPTDSRTRLVYSDGDGRPNLELPWERWGAETLARMPPRFKDIIDTAQAQRLATIETSTQEEILKEANRLLLDFGMRLQKHGHQRLRTADVLGGAGGRPEQQQRLRVVTTTTTDDDEPVDTNGDGDGDGDGDDANDKRKDDGDAGRRLGTEHRPEDGRPAVRVRDASRYIPVIQHSASEELDALMDGLVADFQEGSNTLVVNDRSKFVSDLVAVLKSEFADSPAADRDVVIEAELRRAIDRTLALGVVHARALRASPVYARHWEALVSREALTQKLLGSPDVLTRCRQVLAHELGRASAGVRARRAAAADEGV